MRTHAGAGKSKSRRVTTAGHSARVARGRRAALDAPRSAISLWPGHTTRQASRERTHRTPGLRPRACHASRARKGKHPQQASWRAARGGAGARHAQDARHECTHARTRPFPTFAHAARRGLSSGAALKATPLALWGKGKRGLSTSSQPHAAPKRPFLRSRATSPPPSNTHTHTPPPLRSHSAARHAGGAPARAPRHTAAPEPTHAQLVLDLIHAELLPLGGGHLRGHGCPAGEVTGARGGGRAGCCRGARQARRMDTTPGTMIVGASK